MSSFRSMLGVPPSTASTQDSVLVIIDAQGEYAEGKLKISNIEASRPNISSLLEVPRRQRAHRAHSSTSFHETPAGAPFSFTQGTKARRDLRRARAQGWRAVVTKHHPGSFADTNLQEILEKSGKKKIVLVGYMVSRVRKRGWDVIVAEDAVGDRDIPGVDAAQLVKVALAEIADVFGTLVLSKDIN
ncbi:conserved hypothetical protein [Verticillium alfalfae VaMs.102]|uniref:Isochorismatase-like domain-containing protein n=1 Tax=Verticillium alfalfae (strain VaMs.102 / ATCC MYA-4576 / FGSC 10136) TaxID=526221 RepID=C9SNT7_VERA1|nr:conserved hypothetical protein [Verticillium alfalfae VaMs.102]EEY20452.1 conserved hypothetical protein [Verticillium alfalfae VaMs.102]